MSGNTIGKIFRVTTFGESHGVALGCIIDGMPPGLNLSPVDLKYDLNRRKPGKSRYTTQRRELDEVKILSGIFNGITTGTSIGLIVYNSDQRSEDYQNIKNIFRPGHADYTYYKKYGIRDYRGGGRSSARETVMRVAAGAIAKKYLQKYGISIRAYLSAMGDENCQFKSWQEVEKNPFFCADPHKVSVLENMIKNLKKMGDSIGAEITIIAESVPIGLGEPVFDRLDADLAHALMSINAAKSIDIGDGRLSVRQKGSEHRDEMTPHGFITNHSGGILGGISNGNNIVIKVSFKPTSSIKKTGTTINKNYESVQISTKGRHDPCVGIRAVPITEAMVAIVLMDHLLRFRAQCDNNILFQKKEK